MKRFLAALLCCALLFAAGCAAGTEAPEEGPAENAPEEGQEGSAEGAEMTVTVNGETFFAALAEGEAAAAFAEMLPLTLSMRELNGNEKYFYLDGALPASPSRPGRIVAGDIMLYGNDCIVLFYESFDTSYSYTRIGRIEDAEGLAAAAGGGSAEVAFGR